MNIKNEKLRIIMKRFIKISMYHRVLDHEVSRIRRPGLVLINNYQNLPAG